MPQNKTIDGRKVEKNIRTCVMYGIEEIRTEEMYMEIAISLIKFVTFYAGHKLLYDTIYTDFISVYYHK